MSVSPPRVSLPPLNSMRAFESAARLGGFKPAAAELNVTAGAVAQHVKGLEAWCGAKLFERQAQGVKLTLLGRTVLMDFERAFDAVSFAGQRLRTQAAPKNVSVAALPSIAQLLVTSWMPQLRAGIEGVQISITAMEHHPNLQREPFDLSLFFGPNSDEGIADMDALIPVAAPALAVSLKTEQGFMTAAHVSDQTWNSDWKTWFEAVYPDHPYTGSGPSYSLFSMAVEDVKNGAGILMAHRSLVAPLLNSGALVVVKDQAVEIDMTLVLRRSPVSGQSKVVDQIVSKIETLL